jgi:hypothetical protein
MFHEPCISLSGVTRCFEVHQNNFEQTSVRLSAAAIFDVETPESSLQANLVYSYDRRPKVLLLGSKQSQTRRWRCCVVLCCATMLGSGYCKARTCEEHQNRDLPYTVE